jgi:membrane protease YdiL (CAAX protease family)
MQDYSWRTWLQHIRLIGRVLSFVVCCAVLLIVANPLMSQLVGRENALAIGASTALGSLALTVVFTRLDHWTVQQVGANFEWRSLPRFFIGFAIGLFIAGAWAAAMYAVQQVRWQRTSGIGFPTAAVPVLAYVALAGREELAFRGYPLRRLQAAWGVWPAQLFVAALFAVEHRLGGAFWVDTVVGSAIGSLLFGMASIATEGLAVPIGMHAAWNTGHWALGLKSTPGLLRPIDEAGNGLGGYVAAMLIYTAVLSVATFAFWLLYRRRVLLD